MNPMLNDAIKNQLKSIFEMMQNKVTMVLFTKPLAPTSDETEQLLSEVAEVSDKIELIVKDFDTDVEDRAKYDITLAPSFVMLDHEGNYKGVKFNGIPAGHEINSFVSALIEMSGIDTYYDDELKHVIKSIDKKVDIKVFVTLSCQYCPGAVQTAHRLAMLNPNIKAEMIETNTFAELSTKYDVSAVPKIVINDKYELLGDQPVEAFLEKINEL